MSNDKATPGPWRVGSIARLTHELPLRHKGGVVPINHANACLIAAAPDLLAACKDLEASCFDDVQLRMRAREKAQAAIKKAEAPE